MRTQSIIIISICVILMLFFVLLGFGYFYVIYPSILQTLGSTLGAVTSMISFILLMVLGNVITAVLECEAQEAEKRAEIKQ